MPRTTAEDAATGVPRGAGTHPAAEPVRELPPFNTTLGPAATTPEGPFRFHGATIRVLPLRADSRKLAQSIPELSDWDLGPSLGSDEDLLFFPVPRNRKRRDAGSSDTFVFLVVSSFGRMTAEQDDIGWWADHEVALAVALRTTRTVSGRDVSPHFLYWPFVFSNAPMAVTEGREVLGLPTTLATIRHGADPWLDLRGPVAKRRVLEVDAFDFDGGAMGSDMRLLEIDHDWRNGDPRQPSAIEDLRHVEAFRAGLRFPNLSLKEFRDEEDANRPCYQSLVVFERSLSPADRNGGPPRPSGDGAERAEQSEQAPPRGSDELPEAFQRTRRGKGARAASSARSEERQDGLELHRLEGGYEVRLHRSMSFPIVEALGLEVSETIEDEAQRPVDVCRAVSPFWLHTDMRAEQPIDISFRSVDGVWGQHPFEEWYRRLDDLTGLTSPQPETPVSFSAGSVSGKRSSDPRRNLEDLVTTLAPRGSVYYGASEDPNDLVGTYQGEAFPARDLVRRERAGSRGAPRRRGAAPFS